MKLNSEKRLRLKYPAIVVLLAMCVSAAIATPAAASARGPAEALAAKMARALTGADAWRHLVAIEKATMANGGHRFSGSPGYDASADYLTRTLKKVGYQVVKQEFSFPNYDIQAKTGAVTAPTPREPHPVIARFTVSTPSGGLTAALAQPAGMGMGSCVR